MEMTVAVMKMVTISFGQQWRYFQNGIMAVGLTRVHGAVQYFDASGFQAKGQFITTADGKLRYFDRRLRKSNFKSFC